MWIMMAGLDYGELENAMLLIKKQMVQQTLVQAGLQIEKLISGFLCSLTLLPSPGPSLLSPHHLASLLFLCPISSSLLLSFLPFTSSPLPSSVSPSRTIAFLPFPGSAFPLSRCLSFCSSASLSLSLPSPCSFVIYFVACISSII